MNKRFLGGKWHRLFVLAASAVVATIALRRAAAQTVMLVGIVALITGVAVTVLAVSLGSAAVFFAGSAIAGAGFGSGFQGGIRMVVPLAAPHQRAGLVSLLYVVSYLGLGVPAVLAGFGVVHGGGLISTSRYYGVYYRDPIVLGGCPAASTFNMTNQLAAYWSP